MADANKVHEEGDLLAEKIFAAINAELGGSPTTVITIGRREISVVLQALGKISGFFLNNCPPDQVEEFADLVRHHRKQAKAERAALMQRPTTPGDPI